MDVRDVKDIEGYITKDGSLVKEIFHPSNSKIKNLSFAIAVVEKETKAHYHVKSEEVYFILKGGGTIIVDNVRKEVKAGDVILIPPKSVHKVIRKSKEKLVIVCASSPPYSHNDTVLVE